MAYQRFAFPNISEDDLMERKQAEFGRWLRDYVTAAKANENLLPTWLEEIVRFPLPNVQSHVMYSTRGYAFKILRDDRSASTSDYGVSTQSGDLVYYGVVREIFDVQYPGMLGLRCVAFLCDWYDPIVGSGVQQDQFGVKSIHSRRQLQKYDPFVLASQVDQVCYIPYPRVRNTHDPWVTVTSITPRGRVYGMSDHEPLQTSYVGLGSLEQSLAIDLVVDLSVDMDNRVFEDSEVEVDEFGETSSSGESDYASSDSE